MRTHVDWITFTMSPTYKSSYPDGTTLEEEYADGIQGAFETTFAASLLATVFGGNWKKKERSRAPYTDAWELADAGISLFASPSLSHCCCEISGSGCERILKLGAMDAILHSVHERTTRIDIACDVECETDPREFVGEVTHERMRASGTQISETGVTCYVGSQKSDCYARVYRYAKPHPRSHLLRVEHVFRKEYAKKMASVALTGDMELLANTSGKRFGWKHSDWQPNTDKSVDTSIVSPARQSSNTIRWLIVAAAPAFRRLVENGDIRNAEEFVRLYFLGEP